MKPEDCYWVAMEVVTYRGRSPVDIGLHNVTLCSFKAIIKANSR